MLKYSLQMGGKIGKGIVAALYAVLEMHHLSAEFPATSETLYAGEG